MNWVNTPVLAEALSRYHEGRLTYRMKLWLEQVLELNNT
ncbi:hypothetical protein EV06_0095 [Prochlorococcus sp. MIT 0602]|nr:hypothetical protein EV07_1463 [Prochlorococcus sp. MIT 0603]KGG17972.1 hypothetical protein EV06_0095 [Prochlorococcus sp. MIT 0602]